MWSSSDSQPASMTGREAANRRSGACDGSDVTEVILSDATPASKEVSACTSAEVVEGSQAASTQSDSLTVSEGSTASSPAMLHKPVRRTPQPEQLSPEVPSAPAAGTGTHQRVTNKAPSPFARKSAAALQATYHRSTGSAKPSRPAGIQKRQPAVIPHVAALGALVGALARASELDPALQLYKQVSPLAVAGCKT